MMILDLGMRDPMVSTDEVAQLSCANEAVEKIEKIIAEELPLWPQFELEDIE